MNTPRLAGLARLIAAIHVLGAVEVAAESPRHPVAAEVAAQLSDPAKPFVLVVEFAVQADQIDAFIAAFDEPLRETVKEAGNASYALSRSVDDPTRFLLHERWASVDALDEHLRQPYLTRLLKAFDETLASPPKLTVYTPVPVEAQ